MKQDLGAGHGNKKILNRDLAPFRVTALEFAVIP